MPVSALDIVYVSVHRRKALSAETRMGWLGCRTFLPPYTKSTRNGLKLNEIAALMEK